MASNDPSNGRIVKIQAYLNSPRKQEIFERIKAALGKGDSETFIYLMTRYAEENSLISEALHKKLLASYDAALMCLFLSSEDGIILTGQDINVVDGRTMW